MPSTPRGRGGRPTSAGLRAGRWPVGTPNAMERVAAPSPPPAGGASSRRAAADLPCALGGCSACAARGKFHIWKSRPRGADLTIVALAPAVRSLALTPRRTRSVAAETRIAHAGAEQVTGCVRRVRRMRGLIVVGSERRCQRLRRGSNESASKLNIITVI